MENRVTVHVHVQYHPGLVACQLQIQTLEDLFKEIMQKNQPDGLYHLLYFIIDKEEWASEFL
jgi:hypothetical protein